MPTAVTTQNKVAAQDPAEIYGELFERAQTAPVFADSKYFVDMTPKETPDKILTSYQQEKPQTKDELSRFVEQHFTAPESIAAGFKPTPDETIESHIKALWTYLRRGPDQEAREGSSLIALPYPYIVPGGRFREIYYWDSYFTQLGLLADHEDQAFEDMVKNFAYLLTTMGRIPNGNRTYYRGRSQPPFFSYMVSLWQSRFGAQSATQFLPALKQEHDFWMSSKERTVHLGQDVLNRYGTDQVTPRAEAYKEDLVLATRASALLQQAPQDTFRELRAGAESGWDYSTRWFKNPAEFATIQTTSLIPIDLNSLLYHLELKLADLYKVTGDESSSSHYLALATKRRELIRKYLWDEKSGTFRDYNWRTSKISSEITVAMVVPLFAGVATPEQAKRVALVLQRDFLKPGGLVTTLHVSGQQWDAPNGWAPHQWMAYAGLEHYGLHSLAEKTRTRWLRLNRNVFKRTGRLMEKYNVVDLSLKSGGGEYPLQDGFGWTNGVYRALSTPQGSLRHLDQ